MGEIGSFAGLTFVVSSKKVLTFTNFSQKLTSNWNDHKIIGKKAKKEFVSPGVRKVTMSITLSSSLGVNPSAVLSKLEGMVGKGKVDYLVIGGKPVGQNRFVMTEISEKWDMIYADGKLTQASVDVVLDEYV